MKLITAIIRPEKLDAVKTALFAADVTGITLSQVAGHGGDGKPVSTQQREAAA